MANTENNPRERIEEHRSDLEALAESDLPVNWIAEALLEVADE